MADSPEREFWTGEGWAAQYGFGFTIGLLEGEDDPFGGDFNPEDDPNFAITEAMSESEREAYFYTLYGEEPDIDFENATEEEMRAAWENREWKGCYDLAAEEIFGSGKDFEGFYDEFGDALDDPTVLGRVQSLPLAGIDVDGTPLAGIP